MQIGLEKFEYFWAVCDTSELAMNLLPRIELILDRPLPVNCKIPFDSSCLCQRYSV